MAANSNVDEKKKQEIAKGTAKREYLLTDDDLEELEYETRVNPLNKAYPPMKIFKLSEVKSKSADIWGSIENLDEEKQKRKKQKIKVETRNEEEKRQFWDCDEVYEPLKKYMDHLQLPQCDEEKAPQNECDDNDSPSNPSDRLLIDCDVILCYSDCMNSRPPGAIGRQIFKEFPSIAGANKSTPYNDRKKMGHFCWSLIESEEREQLIVNMYVVHKWGISSKSRASLPVLVFDALSLALRRFSTLLTDTLDKAKPRRTGELKIGTYTPYKVDADEFQKTLSENMAAQVKIYNSLS